MCVRLTSEEVEIEKKENLLSKGDGNNRRDGEEGQHEGKGTKKKIGEGLWPHFSSF